MIRALRPMIIKEFRQIGRDPTSLGMLLVLPSALIVLVGYALNFDVRHLPLAILDYDRSPESRAYLERYKHTESFEHRFDVASYAEVEELFLNGSARIAVVVPAGFGNDLLAGRDVALQIIVDGSDANSAGQAVGVASRLTVDYSTRISLEASGREGRPLPVDFRPRVWYNPDLETSKFLIPGLIGFIMVLTGVVSTSLTVVREKERGTMEQLMVSPLRPIHIIIGKTVPYLAISLVAATAILIIGFLLFGVEVRGSIAVLYLGILGITLGALGQGLLISTVTESQQVAFMLSVFSSLLPSFLLSGFVFPISNMPVVLQVLSNVAVNKFFLVVVRGVMLKGVGLDVLWPQFLYMAAFATLTLAVSIRRMHKRSA
jgi:ABC-2 type transport system permease protein